MNAAFDDAVSEAAASLGISRYELEEHHAYGRCDALAIKLAEELGWPLEAAGSDGTYSHAYVVAPDMTALDIWRVQEAF